MLKRNKILLFICFAALCLSSAPAQADTYMMDATTAAGMRQLSISAGDLGLSYYVGYNPGDLADRVFGIYSSFGADMNLEVGFTGNLVDNGGGDSAIAQIGLVNLVTPPGGAPTYSPLGLSGLYDSFLLPISNDDDDIWRYQAYVTVGNTLTPTHVSGWTTLASETETELLVSFSNIDFSTVTGIGFELEWKPSINGKKGSDEYHTSVVPVPGAVLLGILGLGAVGLKLRKYA